jgi:DNA-binding CsgD family transcriptional regulator
MLALRALEWSTRVEGYAPALLARAIVALDAPDSSPQAALALFDLAFSTRHFDSIVIAFRARPDLAKLVATQEEFRNQITSLLIGSADEAVARGAGLRIPRSMRRAIGLSPRELDVYELMVQGLTNREIARNLFISESTTKVHVRHILEKLGARSRVEAVHTWRPESES